MSSSTESIERPDIVFTGTNGNECEAFVVAVRDLAFAKGMDQDPQWMLRFATTRLRGKALRWHAGLESPIKEDWNLFVQALFNQYPSAEGPGDDEIATPVWSNPAFNFSQSTITLRSYREFGPSSTRLSLPLYSAGANGQPAHENTQVLVSNHQIYTSRQYDASSRTQQIGGLRIINAEGPSVPQYIWWDYPVADETKKQAKSYCDSQPKMNTLYRNEALIVSFLPTSAPHPIGCLNSRGDLRSLVIHFHHDPPAEHHTLYGCTNNQQFHRVSVTKEVLVSRVWNILADGTLQATLTSLPRSPRGYPEKTTFTTTEVHVDTSGGIIRFAEPGAPLEQDRRRGNPVHPFVRARIVFEPL